MKRFEDIVHGVSGYRETKPELTEAELDEQIVWALVEAGCPTRMCVAEKLQGDAARFVLSLNEREFRSWVEASMPLIEMFNNLAIGAFDEDSILPEHKELADAFRNIQEKNKPTNPSLWSQAVSKAKDKFDVYPSAYANAWAAKYYKSKGGGWSTNEETEVLDEKKIKVKSKDLKDFKKEIKDFYDFTAAESDDPDDLKYVQKDRDDLIRLHDMVKSGKIKQAQRAFDKMDTAVRDVVPTPIFSILDEGKKVPHIRLGPGGDFTKDIYLDKKKRKPGSGAKKTIKAKGKPDKGILARIKGKIKGMYEESEELEESSRGYLVGPDRRQVEKKAEALAKSWGVAYHVFQHGKTYEVISDVDVKYVPKDAKKVRTFESVELDEDYKVTYKFAGDPDGVVSANAVGSQTGRTGLLKSGQKVKGKKDVYNLVFDNERDYKKFKKKYMGGPVKESVEEGCGCNGTSEEMDAKTVAKFKKMKKEVDTAAAKAKAKASGGGKGNPFDKMMKGKKDDEDKKKDKKEVEEDAKAEYKKVFDAALKKFGYSSPAEIKDEKKKKEFFNYVDSKYKAKDEAVEADDAADTYKKQTPNKTSKKSAKSTLKVTGNKASELEEKDTMNENKVPFSQRDGLSFDAADLLAGIRDKERQNIPDELKAEIPTVAENAKGKNSEGLSNAIKAGLSRASASTGNTYNNKIVDKFESLVKDELKDS